MNAVTQLADGPAFLRKVLVPSTLPSNAEAKADVPILSKVAAAALGEDGTAHGGGYGVDLSIGLGLRDVWSRFLCRLRVALDCGGVVLYGWKKR